MNFKTELKKGSVGDDVKEVQKALSVQETGIFGQTTEDCVKHYQKWHGLDVDGIVGPKTWAAIFHRAGVRDEILRLAKSFVGTHEQPMGSNKGLWVSKFQASLGFDGQPWCAAFTYYVASQAALVAKVQCPLPKDGYCPTILTWAQRNGRLTTKPRAGDVFLLRDPVYGAKHIGFVSKNLGDGSVATIEGNAGDMVKELVRSLGSCYFVNMADEDANSTISTNASASSSDKIV